MPLYHFFSGKHLFRFAIQKKGLGLRKHAAQPHLNLSGISFGAPGFVKTNAPTPISNFFDNQRNCLVAFSRVHLSQSVQKQFQFLQDRGKTLPGARFQEAIKHGAIKREKARSRKTLHQDGCPLWNRRSPRTAAKLNTVNSLLTVTSLRRTPL